MNPFSPTLRNLLHALLACGLVSTGTLGFTQVAIPASRGELLYGTHCISCHTTQMHWRDGRLAQDWDSLKAQVRRWQGNAGLGWNEADIAEVTRHLNDTIYRHPQTSDRLSLAR